MISIAIDGPAGAGKSTIADALAERLGYVHVDTGALYRAVALSLIRNGIAADESKKVSDHLKTVKVELEHDGAKQTVLLNGENVMGFIRTPDVSMMASTSSALPEVRAFLLDTQRSIAKKMNVIMDGRDIGTVVLPDATVKIFLTADPEIRAKRRYIELLEKSPDTKYEDVLRDVIKRDENDSNRAVAPLKPAPDSITVNTTSMPLDESIDHMYRIVLERIGK